MANTFKGSYWSRRAAYHAIFTDNKEYYELGMRDCNMFGWHNSYNKNADFKEAAWKASLGSGGPFANNGEYKYRYFDPSTGSYLDDAETAVPVTGDGELVFDVEDTNLQGLLAYWEAKNLGRDEEGNAFEEDEFQEETLKKILTAPNKCLLYYDPEDETSVLQYVYFLEKPSDQQEAVSNNRYIVQDGGIRVADVPSRPTGGTYSYQKTCDSVQKEGGMIGGYTRVPDGTTRPDDKVSGKLRLSYDQNTQTWGVQNQVLAQLTTPLDAAEVPAVDMQDAEELDANDFYTVGGDKFVGGFTTAFAIVLSKEQNNPYMFGPNFVDPCFNTSVVEKIRVVNRTTRTYAVNTIVMCHHIDGEWIATDFGADPGDAVGETTLSVGRWHFDQFVSSADHHFHSPEGTGLPVESFSPEGLVTSTRFRTINYLQTTPDIFKQDANTHNVEFLLDANKQLLDVYEGRDTLTDTPMQLTSFDSLGPELGGVADISYLGRINPYMNSQGETGSPTEYYNEMNPFFGPIFPDGFKTRSYGKVTSSEGTLEGNSWGSWPYFLGGAPVADVFNNVANCFTPTPGGFYGMFGRPDPNVRNLPADVGTNGPWGAHSSPIVSQTHQHQGLGIGLMPNVWNEVESDHWLIDTSGDGDGAFNMEPVNPRKVTFCPLTAEMAGSTDPHTGATNENYDRDFQAQVQQIYSGTEGQGVGDSIFGSQFLQSNQRSANSWGASGFLWDEDSVVRNIYGDAAGESVSNFIAYDCYLRYPAYSTPINITVKPFYEEDYSDIGAGLLGVITARNVVRKNRGGVVNIDALCSYGLNGDSIGGSAGNVNIGIIMGVPLGSSSPASRQRLIPGWGSTDNDDIDSFGTTALHVKVYDYWPPRATFFDALNYAVHHIVPGDVSSIPTRVQGVMQVSFFGTPNEISNYVDISDSIEAGEATDEKFFTNEYRNFEYDDNTTEESLGAWFSGGKDVDAEAYVVEQYILDEVDHRVPTYGINDEFYYDGDSVPIGRRVNAYTSIRPESKWNISTVNRGMPLSGAIDADLAWRFTTHEIGMSHDESVIVDGGSGYEVDQEIDGPFGSVIKILAVGEGENEDGETVSGVITEWEFPELLNENLNMRYAGIGQGFRPSMIGEDGYRMTLSGGAEIRIHRGEVAATPAKLFGPKERVGKSKLSIASGDGKSFIWGTKSSTVSLPVNDDSPFPGTYEFFYYFHNDISHTYLLQQQSLAGVNPPNVQFITIDIS